MYFEQKKMANEGYQTNYQVIISFVGFIFNLVLVSEYSITLLLTTCMIV